MKRERLKVDISKRCQTLACLLASLLIVLSFLHAEFSLMAVASGEDISLSNNLTGEDLEPLYKFQTAEETTNLYFFEGYMIWTSSFHPYCSVPITEKYDDGVTITVSGYIAVTCVNYPVKGSESHEHDHRDFKPNFVIPTDSNHRRLEVFTFLDQRRIA
jgi:hypothetical protein